MSDNYDAVPTRHESMEEREAATSGRGRPHYCGMPERPARIFKPGVTSQRENLILTFGSKWVSGTILHYYFFDGAKDGENVLFTNGSKEFRSWVGSNEERTVVRRAFEAWKQVGIGLDFEEVFTRGEAEIRIGFMRGDGAWSYLGRDILQYGPNERTMNFGWDITPKLEFDTVMHEIGHTLGFPHEHQNPKAGIEWDEEAVYAALAEPPNEWDRKKTFWNIIRKLDPREVEGSSWDPNSIMHYPFDKGLIRKPDGYFDNGLKPEGGLSARDKSWALSLYPAPENQLVRLKPAQSELLELSPGEQRSFRVSPEESRDYEFRTFGTSDSVMVLFENDNGQFRFLTADDDSGEDLNASFRIKLIKGREYVLRIRLYHSDRQGQTAVMMW